MKKLFAVLLAATVFTVPFAEAQAQSYRHEPPRHDWRGPAPKKPVVKRWSRGEKLRPGLPLQRLNARDMRYYRLAPPKRGQQWVMVGQQILLINGNGIVVAVAGR